jgi:hypothetical protein
MTDKNTDVVNVLQIYEKQINKTDLVNRIKQRMKIFEDGTVADQKVLFTELAGYASTMEEGIKLGYAGMIKLYDDKCDIEDNYNQLKNEYEKLVKFLSEKSKSNPKLLNEFNKLKETNIQVKKTKRDYNDMIDKYILNAKSLNNKPIL